MARDREVSILIDAKNKAKGAFIEVKKDLRELGSESKKGLGTFSSHIDKADKVVMGFADRMKGLDKVAKRTFQGTAAAASVYVGTTLRDFAQLDDGIAKVNTLYDHTGESQKKMYEDSLRMFKLLPTDFTKITQGIYDTISAGADSEYATMFARKFGMAGVAGDADMDVVTKAAMGTMNAYKLEAQDLNKILDLQFMTVKKGITSYDELASSLGTGVLASAEAAGITLEELQGSIAMITKNAIPASVATTSLNQMFNKFTDTKVIKEFKEYGVEIQDANKKTRPLIEIFKDLNYQFDRRKMSSEQRKGFIKELVGSEQAARAIMPLIGNMKEFTDILEEMDNSSGAMRSAYDSRIESLKVQMSMFWNSLKGQGIEELYKLEPIMQLVMDPILERQKIELDIADLEDALKFMDDPMDIELTKKEIKDIELSLKDIEMPAVDQFRDALADSVVELNKFSPALGGAVDSLGNFILDFMGEEGKEKRDKAGKVVTGLAITQAVSWGSRAFKNFTGKSPWEAASWLIPTAFNLGKKGLEFGVGGLETGFLQALYLAETLGMSLSGLLGGVALPFAAAGSVLYTEKKKNDKSKEIIDNPENFNYSFTEGAWLSIEELKSLNKEKSKERIVIDSDNNVTIGPAKGNSRLAYPKKDKEPKKLKSDSNVDYQKKNKDNATKEQFDSAMRLINTSLIKDPKGSNLNSFSKGAWVSIEDLKGFNKENKESNPNNNVIMGPRPKKENTLLPENDKDTIDRKQFDSAMKLINTSLIDELLKMNKLQEKIENTVNMESNITVEPPKVSVYVDSTKIPTQRVEISGGKVDYRQVEKQAGIQARRYGSPTIV